MYTIDISLKHSPVSLSVQRKEEGDAKAIYNQVLDAMRSGKPGVLELTCEKMEGKVVGVVVAEISAVQITEKSGISPTGKPPGFAALVQ